LSPYLLISLYLIKHYKNYKYKYYLADVITLTLLDNVKLYVASSKKMFQIIFFVYSTLKGTITHILYLFLKNEKKKCYNVKQIIYPEYNSKTYKLSTTDDGTEYSETPSIEKTLKELEDHHFYKTHRNNIINLDHIATLSSSSLTMSNGNVIPIFNNKLKEFKEEFFKHYE